MAYKYSFIQNFIKIDLAWKILNQLFAFNLQGQITHVVYACGCAHICMTN